MIKNILPFYEREHANISALLSEFAEQYPQLATTLGIVDGACEDAHVQRIVEGMVMLGARILQQLEDSYPQFTTALLDINYPHFTQPFPSTSIARVDYSDAKIETMNAAITIPRGTVMNSVEQDGLVCQFRSAYAVTVAPVIFSQVAFNSALQAPAAIRSSMDDTSMITIAIESCCPTLGLAQLGLASLRVFIDGDPSLRATLRDALFVNTVSAYLEVDRATRWSLLPKVPIAAVGLADDEALVPSRAASHPAYRLLTEYFVFPEKFNFFDIDLAALIRQLPAEASRVTLHLAVTGIGTDSDPARILKPLSPKNLLLSCTPVVNLFKRAASPIDLTHAQVEYSLLASAERPAAFEIHSVDTVHVVRTTLEASTTTEFYPYYSMRHGVARGRKGHYWAIRRDAVLAQTSPGYETQISFVDIDLDPLAMETSTVSVMLTCTNRDLPSTLRVGMPSGDLKLEQLASGLPIRFLRKPTRSYRFAAAAHWRLISQLSLNHHALVHENLEAFTEMLSLYDLPQSSVSQRQIRGIVGLSQKTTRAWLTDAHGGARVNGIEVSMTLDEAAFVGTGLHAFVQVIVHFLGLYAHLNTFTQLVILSSASGKELIRCPPRSGGATLV
jgi:type VI secretion system protein ImpG